MSKGEGGLWRAHFEVVCMCHASIRVDSTRFAPHLAVLSPRPHQVLYETYSAHAMTIPASEAVQVQTVLLVDESGQACPGVPVETPPQSKLVSAAEEVDWVVLCG